MHKFIYPLINYTVVDGDTVKVAIDMGFKITRQVSVRIHGIDTPEKRTRNLQEKRAGICASYAARQFLDLISRSATPVATDTHPLMVESIKLDKYAGRIIGDIRQLGSGASLSFIMIRDGWAREYDGGKKKPWKVKELKAMVAKAKELWPDDRLLHEILAKYQ